MTRVAIALAALAVAVASAGCTPFSWLGSPTAAEPRLSQQEFVTRADAICTAAHARERAIDFPPVNPASAGDAELDALAGAMEQAVAVDRDEVAKLRALRPPADLEYGFGEALDELDTGLDRASEAVTQARGHNGTGVARALAQAQAKTAGAGRRASGLGLLVCGGSR